MEYLTVALEPILNELEMAPEDNYLGGEPEIEECDIEIRVAERPLALNYYELVEKNLNPEYKELFNRFDMYMLKFSVGIMDRSKHCNITELGFNVSFGDGSKIQILEMLPQTKFIQPAVTGGFEIKADLDLGGEAKVAESRINFDPVGLSGWGDLQVGTGANFGIRMSFPALSPIIIAAGQYDTTGLWTIRKDKEPLVGNQTFTVIVLVKKMMRLIKYKTQVYCTIRKFGVFNSRRKSEWMAGECLLR